MFGDKSNLIMPIEFQPSKALKLYQEAYDYFFKQMSEATGIPSSRTGSRTINELPVLMSAAKVI